jgi:PAT family beta-lactamase induction signal transducer AmpG
VGIAYGTVGLTALTLGGLAGGWVISRVGLKRAVAAGAGHARAQRGLPGAGAHAPTLAVISAALAVEQFGYGLGSAYLMYMIHVAEGRRRRRTTRSAPASWRWA